MRAIRTAIAALALTTLAGAAQAQTTFGAQVDYGTDAGSHLGIGARMLMGMGKVFTSGAMSKSMFVLPVDFFFPDCGGASCTSFSLNPGLAFPMGEKNNMYVGGGLSIAHFSTSVTFSGTTISASATNTGLNVFGGLHFPLGAVTGFGEARYELRTGGQLVIVGGFMFGKPTM